MVGLMHFGVGKDSLEREKSEGEERPRIHRQREENSSGVGHTSVLKLRPTQGTERTTCYCFFPVPVPAGPLPGEGGETRRRRTGEETVCTAPGGSVQEVSVLPLPVRVNAV